MASGSQNMTTDKARQAFYLEAPHQYGYYTDQYGNFIYKYAFDPDNPSGGYFHLDNNDKTISLRYYWDTGDVWVPGKVGIGYNPTTSGNTYSLYVNGTSYFTNTATLTGQLYINYDQDVGLNQNGSLIIGTKAGQNISFDANEIMSRNNGAASTLYIQNEGGAVQIGAPLTVNSTIYSSDIRGGNIRLVSNWIGFYQNANAGGSRYGYIQTNADRMYFRKENGANNSIGFDFGDDIYCSNEFISGTANGLRIKNMILRNDSSDVWFLIGTSNTPGDNWNSLRPLHFNISNGIVSMDHGLRVVNNSSNNSDDAMVYLENKSSYDWGMKINCTGYDYGLNIITSDNAGNSLNSNGRINASAFYATYNTNPSIQCKRSDAGEVSMYFVNNTAGWAMGINPWGVGAGVFAIGQYAGTGSSTWRFKIDNNGYCYTSGYLNLGGGNENNASSPPRVWGTNGSDNFVRSYQTHYLRVGYLDGWDSNPNNSHPGYGARVFYSWNIGQAFNDSAGYSNGITIGSHPGDQAYGFQIVQNMWNDQTYTRRYNGGWQSWRTLMNCEDAQTVTNYKVFTSTGSNRATLYLRSAANVPNDFWFGSNNSDKWSITCRASAESHFLGFYSATNGTWRMRLYHDGNNYCDGEWHVSRWVRFANWTGLYSPNNGAHFYPNNATSYGAWCMNGSRNGYYGLVVGPGTQFIHLMDNGNDKGLYEQDQRWILYYNRGNQRMSLMSSDTSSGWGCQCNTSFYCTSNIHASGNIYIGSSHAGGYLNGGATNGGINSILIGDDIWLGDCNAGGIMGMKSTGSNCGFYMYNSSGTQIGQLYANGTGIYINKTLQLHPDTGSYTEGIRIYPYGGWAAIMLLGNDNTATSGTSTNSWGIFNHNGTLYINRATSDGAGVSRVYANSNGWYFDKAYGAVWNDFAEYRQANINEPGRVIIPSEDGIGRISTQRLQSGGRIISDTFGFSVGASDTAKTPIGISGRVLAYPYQSKENYHIGDAVCTAPNGTVDIMTRKEIIMYPERIIGIVNEIPSYEIWESSLECPGGDPTITSIKVNGRIWIDIK